MNASSHTQRLVNVASDELERFLEVLFGRETTGFLELRSRRRDDPARLRQHWYPVTEVRGAARAIRRLAEQTDVYVGVAPRCGRHGGKAAITHTWVLWADLDQPAAHDRLARVPVAPGISIRSGTSGHRHLYWPLTDAASVEEAEHANRVLAHAIGADTGAVVNAATILRPPATLNYKREPETVVQLERFDPCPHPLIAILTGLPTQPPRDAMSAPRTAGGDPLLGTEPAVYVEILTGQQVPDGRKISCPLHALSVGRPASAGDLPACSLVDASLTDHGGAGGSDVLLPQERTDPASRSHAELSRGPSLLASSDPLRLVPPPVYFERLTGLRVGRSGKLRCLFHDDRSPSLHVYREPGRGWYCFGCGRGGSIYDLAAPLWLPGQSSDAPLRGRQFVEVRQRLLTMFFGGDVAA